MDLSLSPHSAGDLGRIMDLGRVTGLLDSRCLWVAFLLEFCDLTHWLPRRQALPAPLPLGLAIGLARARGLWGHERVSLRRSFQEPVHWADLALPFFLLGTTSPWGGGRAAPGTGGGGGRGTGRGCKDEGGLRAASTAWILESSCGAVHSWPVAATSWWAMWAKQTSVVENHCGFSLNLLFWKISE